MTEFEQQLVSELNGLSTQFAVLSNEVKGVKEQVAKQNGNVARVTERVTVLETVNSNNDAAKLAIKEESKAWHQRLDPFMSMAIMTFIYLVLDKGPGIVKVLFK